MTDRLTGLIEPGTQIGRYELIRPLAIGGMAQIYLARATGIEGFEKLVVLKRILPHLASDSQFVSMFLDEARLAATLQHPNIAQVYDIGCEAGEYYFVMEFVDGKDVGRIRKAAYIRDIPIKLEHALTIVMGTAAGLHAAHEKRAPDGTPLNIVHRDVTPSNIVVTYDGCVKLIDFGIAKAARRETQTKTGVRKGKTSHMSPEQCLGEKLDRRSDIFTLGILLFELTTASRLFKTDSEFKTMQMIVRGEVTRPSERVDNYPKQLEAIIMRALERDPDDRYQTAQAMYVDLDDFVQQSKLHLSQYKLAEFVSKLLPQRPPEPARFSVLGGGNTRNETTTEPSEPNQVGSRPKRSDHVEYLEADDQVIEESSISGQRLRHDTELSDPACFNRRRQTTEDVRTSVPGNRSTLRDVPMKGLTDALELQPTLDRIRPDDTFDLHPVELNPIATAIDEIEGEGEPTHDDDMDSTISVDKPQVDVTSADSDTDNQVDISLRATTSPLSKSNPPGSEDGEINRRISKLALPAPTDPTTASRVVHKRRPGSFRPVALAFGAAFMLTVLAVLWHVLSEGPGRPAQADTQSAPSTEVEKSTPDQEVTQLETSQPPVATPSTTVLEPLVDAPTTIPPTDAVEPITPPEPETPQPATTKSVERKSTPRRSKRRRTEAKVPNEVRPAVKPMHKPQARPRKREERPSPGTTPPKSRVAPKSVEPNSTIIPVKSADGIQGGPFGAKPSTSEGLLAPKKTKKQPKPGNSATGLVPSPL